MRKDERKGKGKEEAFMTEWEREKFERKGEKVLWENWRKTVWENMRGGRIGG